VAPAGAPAGGVACAIATAVINTPATTEMNFVPSSMVNPLFIRLPMKARQHSNRLGVEAYNGVMLM
jgi:hypothetical protein